MKKLYNLLLRAILTLHTFTYRAAAMVAKKLEPDGMHPKHRLMQYHSFFVERIRVGDNVLDIGCGKGELAFDVAKKAKAVTGIDMDASSIGQARERHAAPNISYILGDATKDLPNSTFDVVILSNVLEHIEHRREFLTAIKHLAPMFLIRVPMINRDWITLYKKEMGVEWRLNSTHYTEYTFEEFRDELKGAGLEVKNHSIQFGEIWAVVEPVYLS